MTGIAPLAVDRFLHDTALALLWGGGGYVQFIASEALGSSLSRSMKGVTAIAVATVAITAAASLPLSAASTAGDWSAVSLELMRSLVWKTSVGHAMLAELIGAIALVSAMALSSPGVVAGLAGLLLCQLATIGHGTDDGGTVLLLQSMHILCGCGWLGALFPFLLTLREARGPMRRDALAAMKVFSRWGHLAVAGALLCGAATAWATIGRLPSPSSHVYDVILLLKVGAVGAMAALAVVNRYVVLPAIRPGRHQWESTLARNTVAEIILGGSAIALVAAFGLLDPR